MDLIPEVFVINRSSGIQFLIATAAVVAAALLPVLTRLFWDLVKPKSPPIFSDDFIECESNHADHVEKDKRKRASVLKQGFAPEKVPQNVDVIIIGSGPGALAAGVALSRAGKRILILEQHDQAGGGLHTFEEKGHAFEPGVHFVPQLDEKDDELIFVKQFSRGLCKWDKLGTASGFTDKLVIGHGSNRTLYHIPSGSTEEWMQVAAKQFPEEKETIEKFVGIFGKSYYYFHAVALLKIVPYWLASFLAKINLLPWLIGCAELTRTSIMAFVEGLTNNKDLRIYLSYAAANLTSYPGDSSVINLGAACKMIQNGLHYPRGGGCEFVYHLVDEIQRRGGAVLVRANVTSILLNEAKSKAIGVQVGKSSSTYDILAPVVISNAGFFNTFDNLLPKDAKISSHIQTARDNVRPGSCLWEVFVGFKEVGPEKIKMPDYNEWWFHTDNNWHKEIGKYFSLSREEGLEADIPVIAITSPSAKDSATSIRRAQGKHSVCMVAYAPYSWIEEWEKTEHGKRPDEYEAFKQAFGQKMLDKLFEMHPELQECELEYMAIGTALTHNYYHRSLRGEYGGLEFDFSRTEPLAHASLRPETGIEGLYLSGQDVMFLGMVGGMVGGLIAASKVLGRNLLLEFFLYMRQRRARQRRLNKGL